MIGTSAQRTRQDRAVLGRERAEDPGVEFLQLDRVTWQVAFQFHIAQSTSWVGPRCSQVLDG
jgi:hypothetical protein